MRWESTDSSGQASPARHTGTFDFGFAAAVGFSGRTGCGIWIPHAIGGIRDDDPIATQGQYPADPRSGNVHSCQACSAITKLGVDAVASSQLVHATVSGELPMFQQPDN